MFLFSVFLFIYASQLILYLYYYYKCKDNNTKKLIELKYDDLYHIKRKKKGYLSLELELNDITENTILVFKKRCRDLFKNKEIFRLMKTNKEGFLKLNNLPFEKNFQRITLNGYQPKNHQEMIDKTYQEGSLISLIIHKKQKKIYICWNHGIMDGIGLIEMSNFLVKPIENTKHNIPLIKNNICILLFSLCNFIINYKRFTSNNIKNTLFTETEQSTIFSFKIEIEKIKKIKKEKNCSINGAIQSIIFEYIKDYNHQYSVVTVIGGEKSQYYNNHGVIPYNIDLNKTNNIPKTIDNLLNQNKFMAPITLNKYLSSCFKNRKKNIDIMFSGTPFSKKKLYLGDSCVTNHKVYITYHSVPLYVFSCKLENIVYISLGVRDRKLQNFLKKYNWDIIQ